MANKYLKRALRGAAKPGSRIPAAAREDFLNSAPTIYAPADPIAHPGERVEGTTPPTPNVVAEATGALAAPEMGLITDPAVAPEDNIHPTPSDNGSATGQVDVLTAVAIPLALPGGGVSEQPLPFDMPELQDLSFSFDMGSEQPLPGDVPELQDLSISFGMGEACAAWLASKDNELSPGINDTTGALAAPEMGLITDPAVAPEDNIHPTPSDNGSATGQVDVFTAVAIPSALPGGGVNEQPLPFDMPELQDLSFSFGMGSEQPLPGDAPEPQDLSISFGMGEACAAWLAAKGDELSPGINDTTGALAAPEMGLITDPAVAPVDNIHPTPSDNGGATGQVDVFTAVAIPSALPGGGVNEQPLPFDMPELQDLSFSFGMGSEQPLPGDVPELQDLSISFGMGEACAAWLVAKGDELSPGINDTTGALVAPEMGFITDPAVAPEDNIHSIPSDNGSATGQVDVSTGVAIPSALPGGGVSEQPLPFDMPELQDLSFSFGMGSEQPLSCDLPDLQDLSISFGMGEACAAWLAAKDNELSPGINDMKDFDLCKAATANAFEIDQTLEGVVWPKVPDSACTTSVDALLENIPHVNFIDQPIPASISATQEGTIDRAGSLAPVENSVRSSSPDAPLAGLESIECIGELDAFAGAPTQENQERIPSPSTEKSRPIDPAAPPPGLGGDEIENISHINLNPIGQSKSLSSGEQAGAGGGLKEISEISAAFGNEAAPSTESDARHTELELVTQEPASTTRFLDGHQLHTPPPMDDNLNFASTTNLLPGAPEGNTADLRNEDSNSPGFVRGKEGRQEEGTPETIESSSQDTATVTTAMEGASAPPPSVAPAVRMEAMDEEGTASEASMDESPSQTPTDTTDNYKFPSERDVLARARTASTVFFGMDDADFDDFQDFDEEIGTIEPTKGSKFHRPPLSIPPDRKRTLYKSAPLTIPIPDTMAHFFFSTKPPAPKWAPNALYFPGGRIVDPADPDYRFFDQVVLFQPYPPPNAFARKTPLPRDKSQDARGLIPREPKRKKNTSIYNFIDKIRRVGNVVDPQIAINAKSVEDFVKAYYIEGPNGRPLLNNPPRGDIPQVKIQHEWIPTGLVERYRVERVIRVLDTEISRETRAALFWILIERQTERTRVLLKFFAQYPEPKLKDVEKKLMSWGYLPEKAQRVEYRIADEPLIDPKEAVKLDVLKETEQLLKALELGAKHRKNLKLLLPFMAKYSIHNMGFFGLMGSDKMIELVEEICNCLQVGEKASHLPSFDVQKGFWGFLNDLRPSVFIARSTSLCDIEYSYVVTQRAEVHLDVFEMVARVMTPILKRISEHDDIPLRREIPEVVKLSLGQTGNAQIAFYLEAQRPRVAMPTAWELSAENRARIKRYEEEQARQEAIKLQKRQKVMRARVKYMEEGIPRDLAKRPAEIYSPKRRRRKIREGKARISRPSEREAAIEGTVGYSKEGETFGETAAAPTNTNPRVTRKRGREEAHDEIAGPSNTRQGGKRVRFASDASTAEERLSPVLHKPRRNAHESDSEASDSSSENDNSDGDRGLRKSRPEAVRKVILQTDHEEQSGESEDEGPQTEAPILVSKRKMKIGSTTRKARAVPVPSQVSKPIPASGTRPPSPVHETTRKDIAAPSWILPDLDHRSDERGEEQPSKASTKAQKAVKKRGDIGDRDMTRKTVSTTVQPGLRTPPLPPQAQEALRRSPRKHQPKGGYEIDSSSSDEDDDGDAYDPPLTYGNKRDKVSKPAKRKGSGKNKTKAKKQALPAEIQAGAVKTGRGKEGRQPRSPIHRDESEISDVDEDDNSQSPPPQNESDISDEDESPNLISSAAQPRVHTPPPPPVTGRLLRMSLHHSKRTYDECDSSSSDNDNSGDCDVPQTSRNTKRTKISEEASTQNPRQNPPRAEKPPPPPPPPPTLGAGAKPAAKAAAAKKSKAEVRSAAAKKAAATRAANQQALEDKVTRELEAEAQRAADAGGYRYKVGAVTKAQVKDRMKREKERMKQEEARERFEAAVAKREQSEEAKRIAAAAKQAAAAKKRAATIAAKKAAVSEKTQTRSKTTVAVKTAKAKTKKENWTGRERLTKAKAEHAPEAEESSSSDEEDTPAEESEEDIELALAQEMSRQEAEEEENAEVVTAEILAGTTSHGKAKGRAAAKDITEAKGTRRVAAKRKRLAEQEASENQASTLKTMLNTACPQRKRYAWMEGHDADQGESSRADEQDAGNSGDEVAVAKRGKRRKLGPRK